MLLFYSGLLNRRGFIVLRELNSLTFRHFGIYVNVGFSRTSGKRVPVTGPSVQFGDIPPDLLGYRLMVGQRFLVPSIKVRILVPLPFIPMSCGQEVRL